MTEDVPVTVTLRNELPAKAGPVSIVFPGQKVDATGGRNLNPLVKEAPPLESVETLPFPIDTLQNVARVTYTFTPTEPGTYLYRSGSRADLQVEMGLLGALIVRPAKIPPGGDIMRNYAYNHVESEYDREFLYLISEMDPRIHRQVENGQWNQIDFTRYFPTNWFINGRNYPDILADNYVPWLPTQPYNCQPRMHPGEKVLLRFIGAGRDIHPMHFHGNDFETIAVDGRLLSSAPGAGPDLAWKATTIKSIPGQTADLIWTWTGKELGWDIYGHSPGDPLEPNEYAPNHGKPFPVVLPQRDAVTYGPFYSGNPFLGGEGELPPGHAGLNAAGGYFYMWHSHTEKELTSNDIWPGGLISFMIVEHPDVPID
ncbi:MAG: hypothetical protein U5R49_15450 [Deltaproteobacteria bacterium]|nr:hypothetical protein [Deltaproteobacteria bacterium]